MRSASDKTELSASDSASENVLERSGEPEKFAFGENWSRFLGKLDPQRIKIAQQSLVQLLAPAFETSQGVAENPLAGKRFLDAGSGSGLFSLSAFQLGAEVVSFDADQNSVGCTEMLRDQFGEPSRWSIKLGSLLDAAFMESLGRYDVTYCWGVAHHTGQMWQAIDHLCGRVDNRGILVLAIYNDQGYVSQIWSMIKRIYKRLPVPLRPVFILIVGLVLFVKRLGITSLASLFRLLTLKNPVVPFVNWATEAQGRGMHVWHDLVDWVGGWPFEVAKPEEIFREMRDRGFELRELITRGGHGCNEFVFRRCS